MCQMADEFKAKIETALGISLSSDQCKFLGKIIVEECSHTARKIMDGIQEVIEGMREEIADELVRVKEAGDE